LCPGKSSPKNVCGEFCSFAVLVIVVSHWSVVSTQTAQLRHVS